MPQPEPPSTYPVQVVVLADGSPFSAFPLGKKLANLPDRARVIRGELSYSVSPVAAKARKIDGPKKKRKAVR